MFLIVLSGAYHVCKYARRNRSSSELFVMFRIIYFMQT